MPLYEYKCENCGEVFEVRQKFSDEPVTVHEKCGGKVHKLISTSALKFKGTGWYVTDYAKGGNGSKQGSSESKGSESTGSKDSSAKSETKPSESKPAAPKPKSE